MMELKNKSNIGRFRNDGRWHGKGREWATNPELFNELDKEFHFTLDVCASDWNAKCINYFNEEVDGLKQSWEGFICWMNPPYGKALNDWMKKAYQESQKGVTVVCLVPAATDTAWWHEYAMKGKEIRFMRKRPKFFTKEGTWQCIFSPSVIVIF